MITPVILVSIYRERSIYAKWACSLFNHNTLVSQLSLEDGVALAVSKKNRKFYLQVLSSRSWHPKQIFLKISNRIVKFQWSWQESETSLNSLLIWKCRKKLLSAKTLFTRTVMNSLGTLQLWGLWSQGLPFCLPLTRYGNWDPEMFSETLPGPEKSSWVNQALCYFPCGVSRENLQFTPRSRHYQAF